MAIHLADVIFRRTDLVVCGVLTQPDLQWCADMMSEELGWTPQQREDQLEQVRTEAKHHLARITPVEAQLPQAGQRQYSRQLS
jgi:hypothetical protein